MRFLCLHGMGTSSTIFEYQLGSIVAALEDDGHELVFLDGLVECDGNEQTKSVFPGPYITYYDTPTPAQVRSAHNLVLTDDDWPFDGVIGFSQGAALATSLLLEHRKHNPDGPDLFSVGIFAGANSPFDLDKETPYTSWDGVKYAEAEEWGDEPGPDEPPGWCPREKEEPEPMLGRYHPRTNKKPIQIPTLHMIGDKDPYGKQSEKVVGLCGADAVVLRHKEGHTIPRDSAFQLQAISAIKNVIKKAETSKS